jgi:tetratricopeptide (TPR) repeat protein/Zn-dependent protease
MKLLPYLLAIAALYGLSLLVLYVTTWRRLLRNPLQYPSYEEISTESVPVCIQQMFQPIVKVLEVLEFRFWGYVQIEPMLKVGQHKKWFVLLYNQAHKTFAGVTIRPVAEPIYPFDIDFYTFFKDRTLLLTMNGQKHTLLTPIPGTVVQDSYTPLLANQWRMHRERLEQLKANQQPCGLAPSDFLEALQNHYQVYLNTLCKTRKIVPVPGKNQFHIHWAVALKLVLKLVFGDRQVDRMVQERKSFVKTCVIQTPDIPLEVEAEGFQYMQQMDPGQVQTKMGLWILLGSLAFAAVSVTTLLSGQALVILIAVLLLHELGHFLAMWCCGYWDTSIFFLPFFGAAAIEQNEKTTLTQKVWVLLAGPLPGLMLGIGLLLLTGQNSSYADWLGEASRMLIVLNLFNLLPVDPLDGGKIANLLWFSRYPSIDLLFKGFAVAVLTVLGWETPLMLAIALIIACTIPFGFRSVKVDAQLRKDLSQPTQTNRNRLLPTIFQAIRATGYGKLPIVQRHNLAKDLLQRHWESHAPWTTQLALSTLYSVSLLGGSIGVPLAFLYTANRYLPPQQDVLGQARTLYQEELDQANQAVQQTPNDVQAYLRRAKVYLGMQDYQSALADYNQAIHLNPKESSIYLDRAKLYGAMQDHRNMMADANRALQQNPKSFEAYRLRSSARNFLGDRQGAIADHNQAEALAQQRRLAQTQWDLAQVNQQLHHNPKNVAAYLKRAAIRLGLRDARGALQDYNQAVRLSPQNATVYLKRADAYYQLHYHQAALKDANQALTLAPSFAEAYSLRSAIRQALGDEAGARTDIERADQIYTAQAGRKRE